MKKATFDPSRLLYLYFRVKRAGSKTFILTDSDGNPFDVSGIYVDYGFELFIKKYSGSRVKEISLTLGSGLTINGNYLEFSVTSDQTNLDTGEYYWELYLNETEKTWLSGKALFHNGEFDGVSNDTNTITINDSGETVTIEISDALASNTRTITTTATSTLTPNVDSYDLFEITAQASAITIAAPTGTQVNGNVFVIRITDNGTGRAITWNAIYRAFNVALPTTTTANKTLYLAVCYNSTDTSYDVVAVVEEL